MAPIAELGFAVLCATFAACIAAVVFRADAVTLVLSVGLAAVGALVVFGLPLFWRRLRSDVVGRSAVQPGEQVKQDVAEQTRL